MARTTPTVQDDALAWHDGNEVRFIIVGTPAWFAWLDNATTFSFASAHGTFTACKEHFQRGGWYWKAYRTHSGKLYRAYLGKAEALNVERLNTIAATLAERSRGDGVLSSGIENNTHQLVSPEPTVGKTLGANKERLDHTACNTTLLSLITTKLLFPRARSNLVARPHLIARLNEGLQRRLTLVSAPAGSGKTTLLSQWSQHSGNSLAWVSLDAEDNDPARFWTYVIAALRMKGLHLDGPAVDLLRSPRCPPLEPILRILINAFLTVSKEVILVLDDYHVIEAELVHNSLLFLLDHLPSQLHLIISSRADPPLPLARLRGLGHLTELRGADLSFTSEETTVFLEEIMKLSLSAEDVAALEKRTERWIVGLQLAALSLQGCEDISGFIKAFAGNHRHILDYLVEEVLHRQPESVQNFLLQTSILDRLNGPLCEAVTDGNNGQALLEKLERANLFTMALDNQRYWYRYHHLFAESLRACLHQDRPDQLRELHRRACTWYADHGLTSEAVGHALAGEEFQLAASLIEQAAFAMLDRGEITTFLSWLGTLPERLVRSRPSLCRHYAWALFAIGQLEAAELRLQDAERRLGSNLDGITGVVLEVPKDALMDTRHILGDVFACRASIAAIRRNFHLTIEFCHKALEFSSKDDAVVRSTALRDLGWAYCQIGDVMKASQMLDEAIILSQASGNVLNAVLALSQLASLQTVQGQLREAAKTHQQALQLVVEHKSQLFPIAARPYLGLAMLEYEWNDLSTATGHAMEGIGLANQGGMADIQLLGQGILARLKQAHGNFDGALDVMERAEHLARKNNLTQKFARIATYRARLWLMQGNVEAAVCWAESTGLQVDDELGHLRETEHATLAWVLIARGEPSKAKHLLERLLHEAKTAGRAGSMTKILVLQCLALHALGENDGALNALRLSLSLARRAGYVRTFVDLGAPMAALLAEFLEIIRHGRLAESHVAYLEYARELLAAFGPDILCPQAKGAEDGVTERVLKLLSEREVEVLELVAAGWSPAEIARDLIVSINTVKTHMKRIYGKLDAHSGTEAVARARKLKLL